MLLIDPKTLRLQIDNYFNQVRDNKCFHLGEQIIEESNPTVTGLALFLGFGSKAHLKTYAENPEYTEAMNYALLRAENFYEKEMLKGNANVKVLLKFFGGWEDMVNTSNTFTLAQFMKDVADEEARPRTEIKH
jgi:hypothetical protein